MFTYRKILLIAFFVICCLGTGVKSWAIPRSLSEEKVIDCSSDLQAYIRMVVSLNRLAESGDTEESLTNPDNIEEATEEIARVGECLEEENAAGMYVVLLRTNNPAPERLDGFETAEMACMVAGPEQKYTIYYMTEQAADAAVEFFTVQKDTIYVERDSEVWECDLPEVQGTPAISEHSFCSWGAESMNYGSYLPYVKKWGEGRVVVAVLDSGIGSHELLDNRIVSGGYDFVDNDEDPSNDLQGHGTHVAGIIADCTYDLPVYLYPLRVINPTGGGTMNTVALAIDLARDKGVDIINLSLEGNKINLTLDTAIQNAVAAGITVICAAGNSNRDVSSISPAHLEDEGVIVVGAAQASGGEYAKTTYSNYGSSVDIYAFGTDILSCSVSGGYVTRTGTSMSAPHITALTAMLKLIHRELLPAETEYRVKAGSFGNAEVQIPDLAEMVPRSEGFYLEELNLNKGEFLQLPESALPRTTCEKIIYMSSDPSVVDIVNGKIIAYSGGNAVITTECTGFSPVSFNITVREDEPLETLLLPAGLVMIEDEAFRGLEQIDSLTFPEGLLEIGSMVLENCDNLRFVRIPASVNKIGENTFSGAVILCEEKSTAMDYVIVNVLPYIIEEGSDNG